MDKNYDFPDEREFVKKLNKLSRIFYYLGCIEPKRWKPRKSLIYNGTNKRQVYSKSGGTYFMHFGFRWWNPLTVILVSVLFTIALSLDIFKFIGKTCADIFSESTLIEVSIFKKF
jgi:hypothetical protein